MKRALLIVLVVAAVASGGCKKSSPSAPTPTISGVTITGTTSFANRNQTAQLTATAQMSDGSTQNVSATATWTTSNGTVASISAAGVVTALANGTATITATYQGKTATASVAVAMKATPEVTPWFSRVCSPYRARMQVTFKESSNNIGFNITALTITMKDFYGVVRYNKSFTTAEITALIGSNHLNAGDTRIMTVEQAYPGSVDTQDSTGTVVATIVDDAGNTTNVSLTGLFQHDGC